MQQIQQFCHCMPWTRASSNKKAEKFTTEDHFQFNQIMVASNEICKWKMENRLNCRKTRSHNCQQMASSVKQMQGFRYYYTMYLHNLPKRLSHNVLFCCFTAFIYSSENRCFFKVTRCRSVPQLLKLTSSVTVTSRRSVTCYVPVFVPLPSFDRYQYKLQSFFAWAH